MGNLLPAQVQPMVRRRKKNTDPQAQKMEKRAQNQRYKAKKIAGQGNVRRKNMVPKVQAAPIT